MNQKSSALSHLQAALAFLTRLVPPPPEPDLTRALPYFPVAGLVLGLLASVPACAGAWLWGGGIFACLLAGLLWMLALAWSTRAMHWDALADVADAAGSLAQGDRFWHIMKDSRVGAFAVLAIVAVWLGQWLCASAHVERGDWLLLALAPLWARGACVRLAGHARGAERSSLGRLVCEGARSRILGCSVACWHALAGGALLALLVLTACLPLWRAIILCVAQWALHHWFARLAHRQAGLSGDFLGADIELSQLCFLLCTL